jgi:hypothetical protein
MLGYVADIGDDITIFILITSHIFSLFDRLRAKKKTACLRDDNNGQKRFPRNFLPKQGKKISRVHNRILK